MSGHIKGYVSHCHQSHGSAIWVKYPHEHLTCNEVLKDIVLIKYHSTVCFSMWYCGRETIVHSNTL